MLRALLANAGALRRSVAVLPVRVFARGLAGGGDRNLPAARESGGAPDGDLLSVVTRELQYEKEDGSGDKQLKEMREALGKDWKVEAPIGSAQVTLSRKNVRLDLDITPVEVDAGGEEDAPEEEEGEDQQPSEGYRMMVSIDGGKGKTMRFACTISDALVVHQAQLFDNDKLPNVYTSLSNESVRVAGAGQRAGGAALARLPRLPLYLCPAPFSLSPPLPHGTSTPIPARSPPTTWAPSLRSWTRRCRMPFTSTWARRAWMMTCASAWRTFAPPRSRRSM